MTFNLRPRARGLLREPLLHFILLGALIYLFYGLAQQISVDTGQRTLTVTASEIDWLESSWRKRWNRSPTPEERKGLIKALVRETILYREALAMGLDKDDTIVRRRLAQKLEFLSQDLLQPSPPSEKELRAFYDAHRDRFRAPDLLTMSHVFFDPDQRGDTTLKDAEAAKEILSEHADLSASQKSVGDPFLLQKYYPERSNAELSKLFGSGFSDAVFKLEPGRWQGPVLSGYGVHLVFVHDRQISPTPDFAAVKEKVRAMWEEEKRRELNETFIEGLLAQYKVVIEDKTTGKQATTTLGRAE